MLRKTANSKGFTIIEVVITIAIGAAVMALVLNAVAGARRSQRNNARVSDVGQIAGALNDYYSNRQQLPTTWTNIDNSVENLGQYQADAATFQLGTWDGTSGSEQPRTAGSFIKVINGTTSAANEIDGSTAASPGTTAGALLDDTGTADEDRFDQLIVLTQARCNAANDAVEYGGIRRMVIVYRLEGQDGVTCRDI